jgi:DNA-binding winged helix-turn-helix (wHTH) protein/tetratricopeptide (TPR) repeat protein/TolB-like protein
LGVGSMLDAKGISESYVLIFEPFTLDVMRGVLRRGEDALDLRRQSFHVLHYLAQADGRVVTSDEIVAAVWSVPPAHPNVSVTQCIKDIRRAMGDDARWMIRTVSGQGYQFKAPVRVTQPEGGPTVAEAPPASAPSATAEAVETHAEHRAPGSSQVASPHRWLAWATSPHTRTAAMVAATVVAVFLLTSLGLIWRNVYAASGGTLTMMAVPTLAVEPLTGMGDEHKPYAGRLAEQITQQLSKSPGGFELSVRTMKPSDGASRLQPTRYALRGVVTATAGRREAIVHLVEVPSNRQVWAHSFPTQEDSDIGRVASQIARTAAVHIRLAESKRPMPVPPEASHYALLGRVLLESERGPEKNRKATEVFDKAVALDPKHFYALLGYARTRVAAVGNGWSAPDASATLLAEAQRATEAAIELNHRNVGVHILRGVIERIKGNSDRALASLEHGREFNPDYPLVHAEIGRTKIDLGRSQDALEDIGHALKLNPTDDVGAIWCYWAGIGAAHLNDDQSAIDWMNKALQRNSAYKEPLPWLAIAHARRGLEREAKALIEEYVRSNPSFSTDGWLSVHPSSNKQVAQQRLGFAKTLERLGVPRTKRETAG